MKLILTHNQRAAMVGDLVAGWFQRGDRVLNLGVGEGYITRHLQTLGCRVTPDIPWPMTRLRRTSCG